MRSDDEKRKEVEKKNGKPRKMEVEESGIETAEQGGGRLRVRWRISEK